MNTDWAIIELDCCVWVSYGMRADALVNVSSSGDVLRHKHIGAFGQHHKKHLEISGVGDVLHLAQLSSAQDLRSTLTLTEQANH
jgi:hypothetical protein